jgi:hypothetical protein
VISVKHIAADAAENGGATAMTRTSETGRRRFLQISAIALTAAPAVATAADDPPSLRLSLTIPELYDQDGKLLLQRQLRNAYRNFHFVVVLQNISDRPLLVRTPHGLPGEFQLVFEVAKANRTTSTIRRTLFSGSHRPSLLQKLAPSECQTEAIFYNGSPWYDVNPWDEFPFGPLNSTEEVELRAIFTQETAAGSVPGLWKGRVESPKYKVLLSSEEKHK